jgi:hypothetical protein
MKKFLTFLMVALAVCASAFAAPSKQEAFDSLNAVRSELLNPIVATYSKDVNANYNIVKVPSTVAGVGDKYYKVLAYKPTSDIIIRETGNTDKPYFGVITIDRTTKDFPKRISAATAAKQDAVVETNNVRYKLNYDYVNGAWNLVKGEILLSEGGNTWRNVVRKGTPAQYLDFIKTPGVLSFVKDAPVAKK